jgi:metalloendopeptidase OMA1, mitochondrial
MICRLLALLATGCLLTLTTSCASLPGAKEPTDQDINAEAAQAYKDIKAKSKISQNKEWNEVVQRVAHRIAQASGEKFQWEVTVIESPEMNAWCMPGGKIAVYTGIMPVLKTEAALAAVLGHEVAHATRRHGKKGYARAIQEKYAGVIFGAGTILAGELFCKTSTCKALTTAGGVAAGFAITFLSRKFSRADETEADQYGQMYMAKAGYDPAESIRLWERMSAAMAGHAPPEWLSTHPSDETRRGQLKQWLPQAESVYERSPKKYGLGTPIATH